jgi:integrase
VASYRKNVRLRIKPKLGAVPLVKLTGTKITTLYRDLERGGRQDHKESTALSARTVRCVHTILKAALREAVTRGLMATNPADKAKPPAARDAKAPEIHPWTAGDLSTFLSWVDEHGCSDAGAYRLLAYTGMRRGELLALRWRDLDTDAGRLSVRRSVGVVKSKGKGEQVIEGQTKTGRQRSVDLDPQTVAALCGWRLARASLDLRLVRDESLMFAYLEGGYLNPDRFSPFHPITNARQEGTQRGRPNHDQSSRPPPYARVCVVGCRGAREGGLGAPRTCHGDYHTGDVPAHHAGNAGRGGREVCCVGWRSAVTRAAGVLVSRWYQPPNFG